MKLSPKSYYYALLCDDSKFTPPTKFDPLVCGIYASKREAEVANLSVKDCPANHKIKRCKVTVEI